MDNHSRFERRRVRADGKHGAVRATMSYARIFSGGGVIGDFVSERSDLGTDPFLLGTGFWCACRGLYSFRLHRRP